MTEQVVDPAYPPPRLATVDPAPGYGISSFLSLSDFVISFLSPCFPGLEFLKSLMLLESLGVHGRDRDREPDVRYIDRD